MASPQVFISYSNADKAFADCLQVDLLSIGVSVWKDDREIEPGDSISSRIEHALNTSDYFLFILSESSITSSWVEWESRLALSLALRQGKPRVVPIRLHAVEFPPRLLDIHYADFVQDYAAGWTALSKLFPPADLSPLRLGGATGTGFHLLKLFIAKFRESFADFPIQERVDISGELIDSVTSLPINSSLDAAIVGRTQVDAFKEAVESKEVFRDTSVLTVFPGHPLWGRESISEEDLLALFRDDPIFVSRPKGSGLYEALIKYLEPRLGKRKAEDVLDRFVAYDLDSAKTFVHEGRGISIMPKIIVNEDVFSGKIWAVELPGNVDRPFYGVWARDRRRSSVAEEFISLLRAGLG